MSEFKLETIEWTQFWRENAPDDSVPRVLLIGDSISVGYRSVVEKHLGGKYHVTAVSTSKAVDNPFFMDEILLAARQETAEIALVHFNNGLHGDHLTAEEYENGLRKLSEQLAEVFPNARLSLALSTPLVKQDGSDELSEKNSVSVERNEKMRKVGAELSLPVDDLYTAALSRPRLHIADGCHFTEEGYEILGSTVADFLLRL